MGPGLTVVSGRNGAGKTNLLEGLYFGCVGRSCRTSNEREVVRFGAPLTRVEVQARDRHGDAHVLAVGFEPGAGKKVRVDGAVVERLADSPMRPLVGVFLPDRLELVKGAPALRRAHVDQVVAALWPARAGTRGEYARALAQRNALLGRIRAGVASRGSLPAWDAELARHGVALMADRGQAVDNLADGFAERARDLGLDGAVGCATALAPMRPTRPVWPPSWPSASTPTSSAASPATAPTATSSCSSATAASCAPTARRASSAWPCSRSSWPSARRWARRAAPCP